MHGLEQIDRKRHVRRRERLTVVPFDVLPQREAVFQAVGTDAPRRGQLRLRPQIEVVREQAFPHFRTGYERGPRRLEDRHEHRRLGIDQHVQRAAPFRCGGFALSARQCRHAGRRQRRARGNQKTTSIQSCHVILVLSPTRQTATVKCRVRLVGRATAAALTIKPLRRQKNQSLRIC